MWFFHFNKKSFFILFIVLLIGIVQIGTASTVNTAPKLWITLSADPNQVQAGQTISATLSATDPDVATGDILTYDWSRPVGIDSNANLNQFTRTFTWTPSKAGSYTVGFSVKDSQGAIDSKEITFVVKGSSVVNTASKLWITLSADPNQVQAGQTISATLSATDPDVATGDILTYDWSKPAGIDSNANLNQITRTFTWTPSKAGSYTVGFSVKDSQGAVDLKEITFVVKESSTVTTPTTTSNSNQHIKIRILPLENNKYTVIYTEFAPFTIKILRMSDGKGVGGIPLYQLQPKEIFQGTVEYFQQHIGEIIAQKLIEESENYITRKSSNSAFSDNDAILIEGADILVPGMGRVISLLKFGGEIEKFLRTPYIKTQSYSDSEGKIIIYIPYRQYSTIVDMTGFVNKNQQPGQTAYVTESEMVDQIAKLTLPGIEKNLQRINDVDITVAIPLKLYSTDGIISTESIDDFSEYIVPQFINSQRIGTQNELIFWVEPESNLHEANPANTNLKTIVLSKSHTLFPYVISLSNSLKNNNIKSEYVDPIQYLKSISPGLPEWVNLNNPLNRVTNNFDYIVVLSKEETWDASQISKSLENLPHEVISQRDNWNINRYIWKKEGKETIIYHIIGFDEKNVQEAVKAFINTKIIINNPIKAFDAKITSINIPDISRNNQNVESIITVKNIGFESWHSSETEDDVFLRAKIDKISGELSLDWILGKQINYPVTTQTNSNQQFTFRNIFLPSSKGTYRYTFQMIKKEPVFWFTQETPFGAIEYKTVIIDQNQPPQLITSSISPSIARPGESITASYTINNPNPYDLNVGLGMSIRLSGTSIEIPSTSTDRIVQVEPGTNTYIRAFFIQPSTSPGNYDIRYGIWPGQPGTGTAYNFIEYQNEALTIQQSPTQPIKPSTQPTVTTTDPTSVSSTSATLTGMLTGGSGSYNIWFEYGPSSSHGSATNPATISTPTPFSQTITGLQPGTVYYYRMFASKDQKYDGNEVTFTTVGTKPNLENKFEYTTSGIYTLDSDLIHSTPYGIKIEASSVVIDGNGHTITPSSKMTPSFGIWIAEKDSNGNAITDVQIKNIRIKNEDTGIFMSGLKNSLVSNVIASENNRAIQLINTDHVSIQNSEIMNNQQGIMIDKSQNNTISKNNVHDNQISGIHLYFGSKNNVVKENTFSNNDYGISMGDVYFTSVDRNTISNNRVHGVDVHGGSSNNNIVNNKLLNNDISVCSDCLNNILTDNSEIKSNTQPIVTTLDPVPINPTSVTLKGQLTSLGTGPCNVWFEYGTPPHNGISTDPKISMTGTGPFETVLTGLLPGTTYQYRSVAGINDVDLVYGPVKTFTTSMDQSSNQQSKVLTISVTSVSPTTVTTGGSVTYSITVTEPPGTGVNGATITVQDGTKSTNALLTTNNYGAASYTTTPASSGTIYFTATKSGYISSSKISSYVTVNQPQIPALTISVTSVSPTTVTTGGSVTYSITVTEPPGTGVNGATITVQDGTKSTNALLTTNNYGAASYTTTPASSGTIYFTATKSGYTSSSKISSYVTVNQPPTQPTYSNFEIIGNVWGSGGSGGNQVISVKLNLGLAPGSTPVDMAKTTYSLTSSGGQSQGYIADRSGGNQDNILEPGEQFCIKFDYPQGIPPNTQFIIDINNPQSAPMVIYRTTPPNIPVGVITFY